MRILEQRNSEERWAALRVIEKLSRHALMECLLLFTNRDFLPALHDCIAQQPAEEDENVALALLARFAIGPAGAGQIGQDRGLLELLVQFCLEDKEKALLIMTRLQRDDELQQMLQHSLNLGSQLLPQMANAMLPPEDYEVGMDFQSRGDFQTASVIAYRFMIGKCDTISP